MADEFATLQRLITKVWGFRSLRPLQDEAMRAVLERRDSLVVLPTGGGKSLCFQAPALLRADETTVVVSPLIALMKDQVDHLRAVGAPAAHLDSTVTGADKTATEAALRAGRIRLLFVSPERLAMPGFRRFLAGLNVRTFAIDEAHCISNWGHDFRPEYRMMAELREHFPGAAVHGYTATATARVREDIVAQLQLNDPEVIVGRFDRPNLIYRVLPRQDIFARVQEVVARHADEAGIIYCIRRKDVDELTQKLRDKGVRVVAYHAGLDPTERRDSQDAFRKGECDLVVATVAFGMGIDRGDVRFVMHTGMPKSIEHYQQESGRAGRDGLEAECVLLFSVGDLLTWRTLIAKSAEEGGALPEYLPEALGHLDEMARYCRTPVCRHRSLVEHFGQDYESGPCGACDICLGEVEYEDEARDLPRKILSCVARVKERFGAVHVVKVLRGVADTNVRKFAHENLSTFGLLSDAADGDVRDWIDQLLGYEVLERSDGEYPTLRLNAASWTVLNQTRTVRLLRRPARTKTSRAEVDAWEGVDRGLFESLRGWRRAAAAGRDVPAFAVFSDATLRDLARRRPGSLIALQSVYGIGDSKLRDYGDEVLHAIADYCQTNDLATDVTVTTTAAPTPVKAPVVAPPAYVKRFEKRLPFADIVAEGDKAPSTVAAYLAEWLSRTKPASLAPWVDDATRQRVEDAVVTQGAGRMKPIFQALNEEVSYDIIRWVVAAGAVGA